MDHVDAEILRHLQLDARLTNAQLGALVARSGAACSRRVNALRDDGVIRRFTVEIAAPRVGLGQTIFVTVQVQQTTRETLEEFEQGVRDIEHVVQCHQLLGEVDYILEVVVRDLAEFDSVYREQILRLPGILRTSSLASVELIKERSPLPLGSHPAGHSEPEQR